MNDTRPALVQHLDRIQQPGHGYGSGAAIVRRQTKTIGGVEFLALTMEEPNGERERLYLTGDGYRVSPVVGSYGDGVRWSVSTWDGSTAVQAWAKRHYPGANSFHHNIQFVPNLTRAAEIITGAREV